MKQALAKLHLAVFLAGFTGVLGRLITLNEGLLVWYRMGITSATMLLLMYFQKTLKKLPLKEILKIAFVGFIVSIHWLCFYGSVKYANVSIALVCFSASSFFSALLDPLILRKRFEPAELFLSMIAMIGIYIILHFDSHYTTGIILGLCAAFLSALFTVLNKRLTDHHSAQTLTFYQLSTGFLCLSILMPFYLHYFPGTHQLPRFTDWIYLLILSWLCTVFAFTLAIGSLKKVSSFTLNLSYNLEPIYGIVFAFLIFHENEYLSGKFYWGIALILLSVALQSLRMLRSHRKNKEAIAMQAIL